MKWVHKSKDSAQLKVGQGIRPPVEYRWERGRQCGHQHTIQWLPVTPAAGSTAVLPSCGASEGVAPVHTNGRTVFLTGERSAGSILVTPASLPHDCKPTEEISYKPELNCHMLQKEAPLTASKTMNI